MKKTTKATMTETFMYAPIVTANGRRIDGAEFPEADLELYESEEDALRAAKVAVYDLMTAPWEFMSDGRGGNAYGNRPEYRATTTKFKARKYTK